MITRTRLVLFALVAGVLLFAVPWLLGGLFEDRFNQQDLVEVLREANVEGCERDNDARRIQRTQVWRNQRNLEALDRAFFNISQEEFTALIMERRGQAQTDLAALAPVDCEKRYAALDDRL